MKAILALKEGMIFISVMFMVHATPSLLLTIKVKTPQFEAAYHNEPPVVEYILFFPQIYLYFFNAQHFISQKAPILLI